MSRSLLRQAFANALQLPDDADFEKLEFGRDEAWSSVAHVELIVEIEQAFGTELSDDDVLDLSSFGKAIEILQRKGIVLGD